MRALITGSSGFIGSYLMAALKKEGHEVCGIDRTLWGEAGEFQADIRDGAAVDHVFNAFKPDVVFHHAAQISVAQSVSHPIYDATTNVLGTVNCLKSAVDVGVKRFIFASSGGCLYGETIMPAKEDDPKRPESPYGVSKLCGEEYLKVFANQYGLECIALRYSNVYGPKQNPDGEAGVVAIFSKKFVNDEVAYVYGDGLNIRDYVYIDDVVKANLLSANVDMQGRNFIPLNISTCWPTSVGELVVKLNDCARDKGMAGVQTATKPARPGDLRKSLLDNSAAKELLNWEPETWLTTGLKNTFDWFYENKD